MALRSYAVPAILGSIELLAVRLYAVPAISRRYRYLGVNYMFPHNILNRTIDFRNPSRDFWSEDTELSNWTLEV